MVNMNTQKIEKRKTLKVVIAIFPIWYSQPARLPIASKPFHVALSHLMEALKEAQLGRIPATNP